jgi:hypothetical protein
VVAAGAAAVTTNAKNAKANLTAEDAEDAEENLLRSGTQTTDA